MRGKPLLTSASGARLVVFASGFLAAGLLAACGDRPEETATKPSPGAATVAAPGASPGLSVAAPECARGHPHETEGWNASPHARHGTPRAVPPGGADVSVGSRWMQAYLKRDALGLYRIVPTCYDLRENRWRDVDDILRQISGEPAGMSPDARMPLERRSFDADCSGCHASGTHMRFDSVADRAATTWRSVAIDCEACHVTSGEHGEGRPGNVVRLQDLSPRARTMVCGRCHGGPPTMGDLPPKEAGHFVALLEDRAGRFPDGTGAGQLYQLSSFLRSPCFLEGGLSCTDCHDPHGPGLRGDPGVESVCLSCHAGKGDRAHTHHEAASDGARCVECHMPRLLGGVMRHQREHRIGSPVPEIADAPDACSACHHDKPAAWVEEAWRRWYGEPPAATIEAAAAIDGARHGNRAVEEGLRRALRHTDPYYRAAAALYLGAGSQVADDAVPEVRLAAVRALARAGASQLDLERFLQDAEPRIRGEAAVAIVNGGGTVPPAFEDDVALVARHMRHATDACRVLAGWSQKSGKPEEALRWLEQALAASRDDPRAWFDVAETHLRAGSIDAFRASVRHGIDEAVLAERRGVRTAGTIERAASSAVERHVTPLASEILAQAAERFPDPAARERFAAWSARLRRGP